MSGGKRYYRIGEASQILGVKPHVLRYWETEFPEIRPLKGKSRHRHYSQEDMEILKFIKKLLYEEGFTIKGAKVKLKEFLGKREEKPDLAPYLESIEEKLKETRELILSVLRR